MKTIEVIELNERFKKNLGAELIDVRTPVEFDEVHAVHASNRPLDSLNPKEYLASRNAQAKEPVYLICRTGARAKKACEKFLQVGFEEVYNVEGGTNAWLDAGLPVTRGKKSISLERQVRIAAGLLVLIGVLLGQFVNLNWIWLSGFVGGGLVFAGLTDTCGMGLMLARMPWNQRGSGNESK